MIYFWLMSQKGIYWFLNVIRQSSEKSLKNRPEISKICHFHSRLLTSKADIKNVSQKGWVLIRKHNFKFEDKREIRNRTNCYAGLAPIQPVSYRFHAHCASLARDRRYGRRIGVVIRYVGLDSLIGPSG